MITRGAGDSGMGFSWYFIALFPGLPTVQVAVCKNEGGRPGTIYSRSDINVNLGRQGGGGWGPSKNLLISHVFFILCNKQQLFCFARIQNSNTWINTARKGLKRDS